MKLVLNQNYGRFNPPKDFCEQRGYSTPYPSIERDDPDMVAWVESHAGPNGKYGDLGVVTIPDNSTDWDIIEYDGWESIVYVIDGRLHWA